MDYASSWKRYKTLRTDAVLGCLVAGYLGRLPWDVSRLMSQFGRAIPAELVTKLTWAAFPFAAALMAFTTVRWMRFRCPGCDRYFLVQGPGLYGHSKMPNPMAGHCSRCGLEKWQSSPIVANHPQNLVRFDELVRDQIALQRARRKRA